MRVAILDDYQSAALTLADWQSLHPAVQIEAVDAHIADEAELARRLHVFEIVVAMRERTPFPASLFARLPNLKLLVTSGMRNAAIDLDAAAKHGVTVCGTDMLPYPTAELTWGLILGLARHIPYEDAAMRRGAWQTTLGIGLKGKVLGLLGLGRLGAQVAAVGTAFGMEIIAWSQNLTAERASAAGAKRVDKAELFAAADVLSIHLVLSARTTGLVAASDLARMKKTAFLVNTSRGPIVDEAALLRALQEKRIAGAAIDVYDREPLPADHPIRRQTNVVVTPHLGYVTVENYRLAYGQAVEDIAAYLAGAPLRVIAPSKS
ncbi:MAG: D-2-hydroxyacid dehydrogenase family protein [Alphaproteobacteria bacterium]|nr:D-2-hydroxyacid dehydrogenase family protein [Alphaproteobacteria bacterium]